MTALVAVPDRPDTTALTAESAEIVRSAEALKITDGTSYAFAVEFGKGIKALQKKIVDKFAPHKKRAHEAWKGLCDDERSDLKPTERAEEIVKEKLLAFQRSEKKRLEAEQRDREEKQRKLDEERRLQEAIDLEEEGDQVAAAAVLDEVAPAPFIPMPQQSVAKVSGAATTKRWTFDKSVDVAAVIKHIAGIPQDQKLAHPELVNALCPETKTIQNLVTAMKENFNLPGIRAYEAEGISLGSK